jgi:DNA-binding CsgD family transcriptional regulator
LINRMMTLHSMGRLAELPQAIHEAFEAAEREGMPARRLGIHVAVAEIYYSWGRWNDVQAELAASAELPVTDPRLALWWHGLGALVAAHRDDRAALATHLRSMDGVDAEEAQIEGAWLWAARAVAAEADGRLDEALDALIATCSAPSSTPESPVLDEDCRAWLPDLVRVALALHRRDVAEAYTRACVAAEDVYWETAAVTLHCRGLLAGNPALVAAAAGEYELAGTVPYRAQALENQAVLLAERGDLEAARQAYDAAAEGYVALEASWDLRRADARLRPHGLRRSRHRVRRRPATGWEALTPTELTVVALVADGLSNPDIAARLHVSRRTVETHVAHVLAKLDGRSRLDVTQQYRLRTQPPPSPPTGHRHRTDPGRTTRTWPS